MTLPRIHIQMKLKPLRRCEAEHTTLLLDLGVGP